MQPCKATPVLAKPRAVHRILAQEQTDSFKEVHTFKYIEKNAIINNMMTSFPV
jgi:hypothetical protein